MLQYGALMYVGLRLLEYELKTDIIGRDPREMDSDEFVIRELMAQRPPQHIINRAKVFANMELGTFDPEKVWKEAKRQGKV